MHAAPSLTGEDAIAKARAMGRKKLAIVGFAPSSYRDAPYNDQTWEVWSLNDAYVLPGMSRADRWFEIHIRQEVDISTRDPNHIEWLKKRNDMPIYMIRKFQDIPMSVAYPIREVVQEFGQYLTNTVTYMILLGIQEGFTTIGVWGVDMAQGGSYGQPSEYAEQRPSCEWALGLAQGRGIHTYIPPASDLLKSPGLYGWEGDGSQMRMKIRGRSMELQTRIHGIGQQIETLNRNRFGAFGEVTFIDRLSEFFKQNPTANREELGKFCAAMRDQAIAAVNQWEVQLQQMTQQKLVLEGAADNNLYWLRGFTLPTFAADTLAGIEDVQSPFRKNPDIEQPRAIEPPAVTTKPVLTLVQPEPVA